MVSQVSKKDATLTELFEICQQQGNFEFDNDLVEQVARKHGFKNKFDATKLDNSTLLPEALRQADYFVLHLGKGRHRFVQGIHNWYHTFEPIHASEVLDWKYRQSILNDFDTMNRTSFRLRAISVSCIISFTRILWQAPKYIMLGGPKPH